MHTPRLDALLAPFADEPIKQAPNPDTPFGYEPFTMPVRATSDDLSPYSDALRWCRSMDAGPAHTELVAQLPNMEFDAYLSTAGPFTSATEALHGLLMYIGVGHDSGHALKKIVWHVSLTSDFWTNLALLRAGKGIIARAMGGHNFVLTIHAESDEAEIGPADGYTNLLRLGMHALCAQISGVDVLALADFADAPPAALANIKERIMQIVDEESGIHNYGPALLSAAWPELLTCKLYEAALGGNNMNEERSLEVDRETGKAIWVGENAYQDAKLTIPGKQPENAEIAW